MKKIVVKTYGDLIKVIKDNHLEDKRIITACEGYASLYKGEYSDTSIRIISDDIVVISDSCGVSDEDDFYVNYENCEDYLPF